MILLQLMLRLRLAAIPFKTSPHFLASILNFLLENGRAP
jgi:hypothetical protein